MIAQFFGGPKKYDAWLTQIADILAKPPASGRDLPEVLQAAAPWRQRPWEIVDHLLATGERLGQWQYDVVLKNDVVQVVDPACGHVIETAPAAELARLHEKYGKVVA